MHLIPIEHQKIAGKARGRRITTGGTEFADYCATLAEQANEPVPVMQADPISSVLSLQEPAFAAESQAALIKRGDELLDKLNGYYRKLILFSASKEDLSEMQRLLEDGKSIIAMSQTNEMLQEVVREIETRLAVEVAKLETRMQTSTLANALRSKI